MTIGGSHVGRLIEVLIYLEVLGKSLNMCSRGGPSEHFTATEQMGRCQFLPNLICHLPRPGFELSNRHVVHFLAAFTELQKQTTQGPL